MLLHDNARPHFANLTKNTIQEMGWEVIPQPPYSPILAPLDFHLSRSPCNNSSIEKNMSEMFQFLHLALHFLVSMAPLTIFKWKNFNMQTEAPQ